MVKAYNFLASWQLFPEKCNFEFGSAPKSGIYKMDSINNGEELRVAINWVSMANDVMYAQYEVKPDGELHPFDNQDVADSIRAFFVDSSTLVVEFIKENTVVLNVRKEIMPNGYLKVTQYGLNDKKEPFENIEVYHKQMSVLPYASSISGVAFRPEKEGVIKHKALMAMEEQTNMQLDQIKEQIELLARQAQELHKRKELSLRIYEASLKFKPQIGHTYHLYEQRDGTHFLSLISPKEWGNGGGNRQFVASVRLLADHTWVEV